MIATGDDTEEEIIEIVPEPVVILPPPIETTD